MNGLAGVYWPDWLQYARQEAGMSHRRIGGDSRWPIAVCYTQGNI